MLYLKIVFALCLSAVPFMYTYYVKPKKNKSCVWKNMFTAIGSQLPKLKSFIAWMRKLCLRIYEGMKKSDSFRKFFTLLTLLTLIAFQFVDFTASTTVAEIVKEHATDSGMTMKVVKIYGGLMTKPHATVLAACLGFSLFSFTLANWILTKLHDNRKTFYFTGLFTVIILFASPRYFIVAETIDIILIAAYIYPDKMIQPDPKGRKRIPEGIGQQTFKKAA